MKPLDSRLLRYASSTRKYIIFIAIAGILSAALIIAQDILISLAISPIIIAFSPGGPGALYLHNQLPIVMGLGIIVLLRALIILIRESRAHRAATAVIKELRGKVLDHATKLGPRWRATNAADTVTLTSRGLEDLQPYFTQYLPQLLLSLTVTPMVLLVILILDFWSAVVALIALPLIPIFMILVGRLTKEFSDRKLATMQNLGRQLIDLIAGLTTLKALGRESGPATHVERLGKEHVRTTMDTLKVAFLSGGILEFISTLSVALVAVEVGLRLVYGNIDLFTGLVVIMLAPEVFDPVRQVGKHFHASADGVAAAEASFAILEQTPPTPGTQSAPHLTGATIEVRDLSVAARGAWAPAALSFSLQPGTVTALKGSSGAGKSTAAMCLLKHLHPDKGSIVIHSGDTHVDLNDISDESWWAQSTWVPQQPVITPGTIKEAVLGSNTAALTTQIEEAALSTGLLDVITSLPEGWDTVIGQGGIGLSVGQRQRLALTRALLTDDQLVVMDEPTAHLDANLELNVLNTIERLKAKGKTVVVIAHRAALVNIADFVVEVNTQAFTAEEAAQYAPEEVEETPQFDAPSPGFLSNLDQSLEPST
ncbi:MAG: thiol reductant ABC exporter subunit CydD [Actinomycetaceae bacterium]|nr:thiol reductant ABC exporter subunit CydD [Actinomycetaceae bacterium]